jgi:hypothetical protein
MLIKNSFHIKSSGFDNPHSTVPRRAATVLSQLNTSIQHSLDSGLLHTVVNAYKQNPFMVSTVAIFSLISFVFVIVIFALAGGNQHMLPSQQNLFSDSDDVLFDNQYTKAKIKYDLNEIALNVIEGKAWNRQHIDKFTAGWSRLDALEKAELKQTVWFQLLENTIKSAISAHTSDNRGKLLADLAVQLGVSGKDNASSVKAKASAVATNTATNSASGADDRTVQAPIANAQTDADTAKPLKTALDQADAAAMETLSSTTQLPTTQTQSAPSQLKNDTSQDSLQTAATQTDTKANADLKTEVVSPPSQAQTNSRQLASVTSNTPKPRQVNKIIRTPIATETPAAAKTLAKSQQSQNGQSQSTKLRALNNAELKRITNEFVTSYESGNIINFTSLFAEKAVSNDEEDLTTIRKEYAKLFATTSDRRMIIDNLKWNLSDTTATGKGRMKVKVKAAGASKFETYSGTIQIVVEKQAGSAQITKLFHSLQ